MSSMTKYYLVLGPELVLEVFIDCITDLFASLQEMYPKVCEDRIASLVGGFFLLRFINPAIVSPYSKLP